MDDKAINLNDALSLLSAMPYEQKVLLGLAACTWIVGGNLLTIYHNRRVGIPWYHSITKPSWPFKNFNKYEWLILTMLAVSSMALAVIGINYGR